MDVAILQSELSPRELALHAKRRWYWTDRDRVLRQQREHSTQTSVKERKAQRNKKYHETHREHIHNRSRAYRAANCEALSCRRRIKYLECADQLRERGRHRAREYKYGISRSVFEEMLKRQSGLCAICGDPMKKPCVDHNHRTGKNRDLLCSGCNKGIGFLRESEMVLLRAIAYLKKHGETA